MSPFATARYKNPVIAVALVVALLAAGVVLLETSQARRDAAQSIQIGMPRAGVVQTLGVFYDEEPIRTCHWRIAYSRDMFVVTFDKDERVVAITWELRS